MLFRSIERSLLTLTVLLTSTAFSAGQMTTTHPFYRGLDISMLPTLEHAGAKFMDAGKPTDLPVLMQQKGCNLFRLRLFVDPKKDYATTYGATQDLTDTLAMARRVKATGAEFLLDLHYSDTWADPSHQDKPKAWAGLHGEALGKKVFDYTVETLQAFKAADLLPDMVQVGNEIQPGMLWPDGKITNDPATAEQSWINFAALLNAGIRGVRAEQDPRHPIKIMIHIHGGGREGLPPYFFEHLTPYVTDFDLIGLSFYPGDNETLPILQKNMETLISGYDKDVVVAETAYPNRPIKELRLADLQWPTTPEGQKAFLLALRHMLSGLPGGHGAGFIYWYPEAIKMQNLWTWREGALALFDSDGACLPGIDALAPACTNNK